MGERSRSRICALMAAGCDICAIGDAHYVKGDINLPPKARRAAKLELERIEREYADRDHLRLEIARYLQSIGRGVAMPIPD
ncbi:hypothetical protein GV67_13445 [Pseudorhizobium pelagicum]|uniref:Uncharacterized protein n=1 Tax=Pseudorhizobium pelagicum TaxID=1509405 RepID=A0A922NXD4_9HYPH|nr:hypothetical protein GV67_13445 [Pseudorhizobium pelagicum]KEQ04025.1 hypothetical protein GV68_14285 [Pseudorhizobium pelagicum]